MKLIAAQLESTVKKTEENIVKHCKMLDVAIEKKANLIVFPEMSLTGYCREEAKDLCFTEHDARLEVLQVKATKGNIIIVVGAPIQIKKELYIGSFVLYPNGNKEIYTKQYLHTGEELYFKNSFAYNPLIDIKNTKICLAICADISHEIHPKQAKNKQADLYVASIFYTDKGIPEGHQQLKNYADKYKLNVLMSNYCGEVCGIVAGGKSAFWTNEGSLVSKLNKQETGLLCMTKKENEWFSAKFVVHFNE